MQRDGTMPPLPCQLQETRYHGLLIHLPDGVFCPECEEESDDIALCLDRGGLDAGVWSRR